MKNGVPFDVAFSMDHVWRMAFVVTFGTMEGNEFDWSTMKWMEKE